MVQREIELESELKNTLKCDMIKNFGESGSKFVESLDAEDDSIEDCTTCGKDISEADMNCLEKMSEYIDIFMSFDLTDVVKYILTKTKGNKISIEDIKCGILEILNEDPSDELINRVKIKIMFDGITNEWLNQSVFVEDC